MLSQLRKLEEKYYRELVVIGVHSAKFTGEIETPSLSQAILRNELSHPVVNDNQFLVWKMGHLVGELPTRSVKFGVILGKFFTSVIHEVPKSNFLFAINGPINLLSNVVKMKLIKVISLLKVIFFINGINIHEPELIF